MSDVDGVDLVAGAAKPNFGGHRGRVAGLYDLFDDRSHFLGLAEQIAAAFGPLGYFFDRATKVDIDDADLVVFDQTFADFGHGLGMVIPDLNGEWFGFLPYAPKSFGMLGGVFVQPDKAAGVDHLGCD